MTKQGSAGSDGHRCDAVGCAISSIGSGWLANRENMRLHDDASLTSTSTESPPINSIRQTGRANETSVVLSAICHILD